uniref:AlNc14C257G9754 protein n=1 Tax=Albugo laibachii Nc14 TaxID=890382 RepID=F0WTS8_9STRA|nr:AlNc14C257G9754 [Albugo laibachii Nc14]|eukprot:CCA24772.1 AlNc14C257G9754 [Albugo laibachii Nc14]
MDALAEKRSFSCCSTFMPATFILLTVRQEFIFNVTLVIILVTLCTVVLDCGRSSLECVLDCGRSSLDCGLSGSLF